MSDRKTINITLGGFYEGEPISPYVVDIAYLKDLLDDVEKLVSIETKAGRDKITLRLEEGSLQMIIEAPTHQINSLKADLDELNKNQSLSALHPRRRKILKKWHNTSQKKAISYDFGMAGEDWEYKLNKDTRFKPKRETWFGSELYLFGEITDIGGKTDPNFHIETKEFGSVKVLIPRDVVRSDEKGRTYKFFLVKVSCEQEIVSGKIRNAKFIEWVDYYPGYDEKRLQESIDAGKEAWKGVLDSAEYIRKLRGYDD